ncbi:DNA cytosine methyltransferase [Arenimonas composti]|uniref:DNA cytosine methyltransferase n=1 Tax=Arenimonas composti TaxID=370776 RepID=UPI00137713CB|nr:DNA cytosine methyltransferase [Arenimonas composti]
MQTLEFERFEITEGRLIRHLRIGDVVGSEYLPLSESVVEVDGKDQGFADLWDRLVLRGAVPRPVPGGRRRKVRIVDLFCGAGGLSFGVCRGLRAVGFDPVVEFAADLDPDALRIYKRNIGPVECAVRDAAELVDFELGVKRGRDFFKKSPWVKDRRLASRLSCVDVLIGGPPCQGHSNFNNHTRRFDERNELYLIMPALAIALDIPVVIIENVREVKVDHHRVVDRTRELFEDAGYGVSEGVISALDLGIPQTRKRYFLVATKPGSASGGALEDYCVLNRARRTLDWGIGDLEEREFGGLHSPAVLSAENRKRIDWLFDNDAFDLADSVRPECHRNGHSYKSVYGRLAWDKPAGTITTGFHTPGRGRYVHPSQRRALTAHEAARIQGFPDSFEFLSAEGEKPTNKTLAKVIGDAVPPVMGEAAILAALRQKQALCKELSVA